MKIVNMKWYLKQPGARYQLMVNRLLKELHESLKEEEPKPIPSGSIDVKQEQ